MYLTYINTHGMWFKRSDREVMVYLVIYRSSKSFCQLSFHYDLPKDQQVPSHLNFFVLSRQSNSRSTKSRRNPSGWELHELLLTALYCVLPEWSMHMVFSCLGIYRRAWECYGFFFCLFVYIFFSFFSILAAKFVC